MIWFTQEIVCNNIPKYYVCITQAEMLCYTLFALILGAVLFTYLREAEKGWNKKVGGRT